MQQTEDIANMGTKNKQRTFLLATMRYCPSLCAAKLAPLPDFSKPSESACTWAWPPIDYPREPGMLNFLPFKINTLAGLSAFLLSMVTMVSGR